MNALRLLVLLVIAAMATLGTITPSLAERSNFALIPQTTTIPMPPGCITQPIKVASQAQSGKKLTADQVKQLVDASTEIKSDLGCR